MNLEMTMSGFRPILAICVSTPVLRGREESDVLNADIALDAQRKPMAIAPEVETIAIEPRAFTRRCDQAVATFFGPFRRERRRRPRDFDPVPPLFARGP